MADSHQMELYRAHRTGQEKYVYFLLAAAGAAIAFALNQTHGAQLTWSQIPLGLAVICWSLSFSCGCYQLQYVSSILLANFDLSRVERGEHPEAGNHPQIILAASQGIRSAIDENMKWVVSFGRWQFQLLTIGAAFYIAWHVITMWLRTVSASVV